MRTLPTLVPLTSLLLALLTTPALAQTGFTYQGRLDNAGQPANGAYDLRFRLLAVDSSQVGPTLCANNVQVEDGLFTVVLDPGTQFNTATTRSLEVSVRVDTGLACADATGYTTLSPAQPITPAPRATAAATANSLTAPDGSPSPAVSVNNDGWVGIGTTTPSAQLHVVGGDLFSGGAGEEWLFHTRAAVGGDFLQITDADNGVLQFGRGLVVHENGTVGIGTTFPTAKLDVRGDIRVGPSANYYALKSPNPDRTLRGRVNFDGTIDTARSSPGFTVTKSGVGVYVINFSPTFGSAPVIVTTPTGSCCKTHITQTQTNFATVFVQNVTTNAAVDSPFFFIVMGN